MVELSESTSRTLLQRVQRREAEAWQRFSILYSPLVYRWALTNGVPAQDAADVTQDVFHAVFQSIGRFRRDSPDDSLRGWLWTIARNKICDYFRSRHTEPRAEGGAGGQQSLEQIPNLPVTNDEPAESIAAELSHRALELIQTEFETTTWQAFWGMAVDGAPAAEVAQNLGLTVAAVYKAKSRVLHRLRHELEGLLDPGNGGGAK